MLTFRLDLLGTPASLLERLFLHETRSPLYATYNRQDSLRSMRLMRQVLENRLKYSCEWGVPGARSLSDIIMVRSQFGPFADYPDLPARFMRDPYMIVKLANTPSHLRHTTCSEHVGDAITAATESAPPTNAIIADVVAWRTEGHGSPGPVFRLAVILQGNAFFTVKGGH